MALAEVDNLLIELPIVSDDRGNLTVIESLRQISFSIKRVYYISDVPVSSSRAGHAHRELSQLIIAINGSFSVLLDNGVQKKRYILDKASIGLLVPPMIWREINNFSPNAVCLVLASDFYNEADYYRNYNEFIKATRHKYEGAVS